MKLYLKRALKYIVRMSIIIGIIFGVMILTNTFDSHGMTVLRAIFMTWRGAVIIALLLVLAAIYPKISFATVEMRMDMKENREHIVNALASYGYSPAKESDDEMVFRVNSKMKRVLWQFDDPVRVRQNGSFVEIEGLKKVVLRVDTRLHALLSR